MWEALTGKNLFDADNSLDVIQRVRNRQAPALKGVRDEVPQGLSDLVAKLLMKNPNERPNDIQEVVDKVDNLMRPEPRPTLMP